MSGLYKLDISIYLMKCFGKNYRIKASSFDQAKHRLAYLLKQKLVVEEYYAVINTVELISTTPINCNEVRSTKRVRQLYSDIERELLLEGAQKHEDELYKYN